MLAFEHTQTADRPQTAEERLASFAEDLITLNAEGGATLRQLCERGWSPKYIEANREAAATLANKRFVRDVDAAPHRSLTKVQDDMADVISSLLPPTNLLVAELQARGFATTHIDLLMNKARAKAALAFCLGRTGWAN